MFRRKSECQKVRGLLSPYIDQRLSASETVSVERHVAECAMCRGELESLRATVNLLHRVPVVSSPRSFAITELEPRQRRVSFALASSATAIAMSAMAFFFVGDAFDLFESHVVEKGLRYGEAEETVLSTPAPSDVWQTFDAGGLGAQATEKWPVWQIEIALIGAVVVLGAVTFVLWRRRRRAVGARVGRA